MPTTIHRLKFSLSGLTNTQYEGGQMEAKQPTEAQIKEFWEWCGFSFMSHFEMWIDPSGTIVEMLPLIDLNSLFKYATPKLGNYQLDGVYTDGSHKFSFDQEATEFEDGIPLNGHYESYNKDPALALFWAIWEAIDGS